MDAPPIPRLVDLVHVFKGVVVEQFKKRLEKLLSDSILLWRLLKLLFKILHINTWPFIVLENLDFIDQLCTKRTGKIFTIFCKKTFCLHSSMSNLYSKPPSPSSGDQKSWFSFLEYAKMCYHKKFFSSQIFWNIKRCEFLEFFLNKFHVNDKVRH